MAIGALLREIRQARGWSQDDLAEQLRCVSERATVTRETVSRWEQDRITPGKFWRNQLAQVFEIPAEDLLDYTVAAASSTATSAEDVHDLVAARERYETMYRQVGGVAVRPRLLEFLQAHATPRLHLASPGPAYRRSVSHAVGSLTALAGVCAYDACHHAAARHHYQRALELARGSEDDRLVGHVLSLQATQALRTDAPSNALDYVRAALMLRDLSPALLADLQCTRAEAHALLGDKERSAACMDAAYAAANRIDNAVEPAETGHVQPGVLEGRHAEVLRALGDVRAADEQARRSLTHTPTHPRGHANRLAVRAKVLISANMLDEAADTGSHLVDLTEAMESRVLRDRIRTVAQQLDPHRRAAVAVAEFCDRATTLLRAPL